MTAMVAFGIIEILILLFIGTFVVIAIVSKRPGLIVGISLLLLLVFGVAGAVLVPWIAYQRAHQAAEVYVDDGHGNMIQSFDTPTYPDFVSVSTQKSLSFGAFLVGLPIVLAVVLLLAFSIALTRKQAGDGKHQVNWWPALALIPLAVCLFLFGTLEVRTVRSGDAATVAEVQIDSPTPPMSMEQIQDKVDGPKIELIAESSDSHTPAVETVVQQSPAVESKQQDKKVKKTQGKDDAKVGKSDANETKQNTIDGAVAKTKGGDETSSQADSITTAENSTDQRPTWVIHPPKRFGDVIEQVIVTDEYSTVNECNRAIDVLLLLATYNRVMQLYDRPDIANSSLPELTLDRGNIMGDGQLLISNGAVYDPRLQELARAGIGIDFARGKVVQGEYIEEVQRSVGLMQKLYAKLSFSDDVDRELRQRWDAHRRDERFFVLGTGALSVLGLLGLAWGVLKVDTMTKGYYTKPLFLGVPAAIIGVLLFLALISVR